jgi:hypothetical protein
MPLAAREPTRRHKNLKQWDLAQRHLQKKKNTGSLFYLGIF